MKRKDLATVQEQTSGGFVLQRRASSASSTQLQPQVTQDWECYATAADEQGWAAPFVHA